jgi:hypothetical protein
MTGNKYLKRIMVPLLMLSVLLLLLVPGCGDKEAPETAAPAPAATDGFSQAQMQQILADTMLAVRNAGTYKCDINMNMAMEATGGPQAGNLNIIMTATGVYDQVNKNMQMVMNMTMETDMEMGEMEEAMQDISMEMYVLDDTMYMKMDMPVVGEQWVKMPVDEEIMQTLNSDMVSEQLDMLESAGKIEFLRNETVEGHDCYVFKLVPDMAKIMEWVAQNQMSGGELDPESIPNMADVFKDLSYVVWIDKDADFIMKMDADMLMEFTPEEFGAESDDFDNMKMNVTMGMRMFDYNKPVTINVPEEAKDAIEMPGMGNIGQ